MIELERVGVCFARVARRRTLGRIAKDAVSRLSLRVRTDPREERTARGRAGFWALREIDLRIGAGQCVGIVGVNGSGKSTLLQVMAGIYRPTTGQARVEGKVSALVALSSGFNPELTGLENIYLTGLLLGLSKRQIDELVPGVLEFCELEDFIYEPVRTYSTGMAGRLGFSIATAAAPDVLLVDEVLSVGDGAFAKRSEARVKELIGEARVVCLCSHNLQFVREKCGRVVWLDGGRIAMDGASAEVLGAYQEYLAEQSARPPARLRTRERADPGSAEPCRRSAQEAVAAAGA